MTAPATAVPAPAAADAEVLQVRGLRVSYGGVRALAGVDLDVARGSILGLIGPNGAGKTTLFECIAGFTTPDEGTICFGGVDVTSMRPEQRGMLGLIRSFQDARLFPSLTVHQTVVAAFEREQPSRLIDSLLALPRERRRERDKARRADALIESMGLVSYRDKFIRELSTGTRRIVELACVVALDPTVLLLDEPSSGIAQRESEALGPVLRRVQELTGATMLIIEHDMPLVMGLAEEIVAMESGRVIARGTPDQVRDDPAVIASYLGTDGVAVARSGATEPAPTPPAPVRPTEPPAPAPAHDGRCCAVTKSGTRCRNRALEGTTTCGIAAHRRAADAPPSTGTETP